MERTKIPLRELMFLIECEVKAQNSSKLGYAGADHTADQLISMLNVNIEVPLIAVEAALSSFRELKRSGYSIRHHEDLSPVQVAKRCAPAGWQYDDELGIFNKKE